MSEPKKTLTDRRISAHLKQPIDNPYDAPIWSVWEVYTYAGQLESGSTESVLNGATYAEAAAKWRELEEL